MRRWSGSGGILTFSPRTVTHATPTHCAGRAPARPAATLRQTRQVGAAPVDHCRRIMRVFALRRGLLGVSAKKGATKQRSATPYPATRQQLFRCTNG